jgi:uncharacterized membrane protein YbhN (UPF0104 family)
MLMRAKMQIAIRSIALVAIGYAFWRLGRNLVSFRDIISFHVDPVLVGLCFGLTVVNFNLEWIRWKIMLSILGIPAGIGALYHVSMASAFGGYLLPFKLGIPFRVLLLHRQVGIPVVTVTALITFEFFTINAAWAAAALPAFTHLTVRHGLFTAAVILAGIGLAALIVFHRLYGDAVKAFLRGLWTFVRPRLIAVTMLFSAIDIFVYGLSHLLILSMLGYHLQLSTVVTLTALGFVAGYLSLLPSGLGVYDAALAVQLQALGVSPGHSIAVPLVHRAIMVTVAFFFGGFSFARIGRSARIVPDLRARFSRHETPEGRASGR